MKKALLVFHFVLMIGFAVGQSTTTTTQSIVLPSGWSLISTYLQPIQPNAVEVFDTIVNNLEIVKADNGLVYWPAYSLNLIQELVIGKGYQIKLSNADTLAIVGGIILPDTTVICIPQGWSFLGYLHSTAAPITNMLAPVFNNLMIAKDGQGMVYWPQFNLNLIGDMQPGKGYQIKMLDADTLVYPMVEDAHSSVWMCGDKIYDVEGNPYNTVLIGYQCWMKENLDVTHYSNGTAISCGNYVGGLQGDSTSKYYFDYGGYPPYSATYGRLYTWAAATNGSVSSNQVPSNVQGVCPDGWHLPSDKEWSILQGTTDSYFNYPDPVWDTTGLCGYNVGKALKSVSGWSNYDAGFEGLDLFGFKALPGGGRNSSGAYCGVGYYGYWWSSTENVGSTAWIRLLGYCRKEIIRGMPEKSSGYSVRCLKDTVVMPQTGASVSSLTISNISETTALCEGHVTYNGGSAVSARGVCWNTTGNPTVSDSVVYQGVGLGGFQALLASLSPNTSYYVRAFAQNTTGISYGNLLQFATQDSTPFVCGNQIIDADGNQYNTVDIGAQCWMKQNLRTIHYADGTELNDGSNAGHTIGDSIGHYYFSYGNTQVAANVYGRLYSWEAVVRGTQSSNAVPSGIQGVCPIGWHVPSDEEWKILEGAVDSLFGYPNLEWDTSIYRGYDAGKNLKSTSGWYNDTYYPNGNGTDLYGFTAVPGGMRHGYGAFALLNKRAVFWSSTSHDQNSAWYRLLEYYDDRSIRSYTNFKAYGYSVRCLKD